MKTVTGFARARATEQRITVVTCYDAWSAGIIAQTPVDAVLVGDSVAMVVHGLPSTVHATTEMLALHTAAVKRGLDDRLVITDVPFPEHRRGADAALRCADQLMKAGAGALKVEGARGHLDTIAHLVESGVPVMGHLGLTPQSVNQLGGYRVQGRGEAAAQAILDDACALEQAGVFALVLECVPLELARRITDRLAIPTIGIGSGVHCSGQVLVLQDLLGMNGDFRPRFLRTYCDGGLLIADALRRFDADVKSGAYPALEESFAEQE